jgi:adenine phosphoribosyltransferase
MHELARYVRNIPDFPKKGIMFRDITTLLKDGVALRESTDILYERYKDKKISKVVCVEARGFILGGVLATRLGAGFVPIRKKGKLPAETLREEYALEYGTDTVEIHKDAITPGEQCLLHDDLLATGGTMLACAKLVRNVGGVVVGISFLIELDFLKGRDKLKGFDVHSIIQYDE